MDDIWSVEKRLWTDGADAYEELMAANCTMVFGLSGIMKRADILKSLRRAPRWSDVTISNSVIAQHNQTVVVLAYQANAERESGAGYEAVCSSTYIRVDGQWRIAQHQQTAI